MAKEDLQLNPKDQDPRVREDMRRIEEWAKKRRELEEAEAKKALIYRYIMMGT